jgi:hypothetical protein
VFCVVHVLVQHIVLLFNVTPAGACVRQRHFVRRHCYASVLVSTMENTPSYHHTFHVYICILSLHLGACVWLCDIDRWHINGRQCTGFNDGEHDSDVQSNDEPCFKRRLSDIRIALLKSVSYTPHFQLRVSSQVPVLFSFIVYRISHV